MSSVTVTLCRYNPATDAAPAYATYEVPWKEHITVLQCLNYINEYDEPITFDFSCRAGLCGRCGVTVNDKPCLACYTPLDEGGEYTIEPLKGFPVIRDLVVDKSALADALADATAEVTLDGPVDMNALPELDYEYWYEDLHRKNMCRECGLCFAACPVYQEDKNYAGPATLSQVYLRAHDGMDKADRVLQAVELGVFNCQLCGECTKVCPSYIDHVACNRDLQEAALARGLKG